MKDSVNKKNRIEAVIFDWAGTTIDYGCFAPLKGFMDGFGAKGVTITAAEARKPMGMLKLDHVRVIARMERVREAYERENGHLPKEEDIQEIYGVFKRALSLILSAALQQQAETDEESSPKSICG